MKRILLGMVLLMAIAGPGTAQENYEEWHQQRLEKLTRSDGYLSLVGMEWLKTEPTEIDGVGLAWVEEDGVHLELEPGYSLAGQEVETVTLDLSKPEGEELLVRGTRSFYAIKRGDWTGLRIKDSQAPTLVGFQGVSRFENDPAWRLRGRLIKDVRTVDVGSVVGVDTAEESPGWAEFEVEGETYRALLIGKLDSPEFFMVFSDATAGKTTYEACRFLYLEREGEDGLVLDFNKSINPPCAFTHFATCPLPPEENIFPFAIPVGEKAP